MLKWINHLFGLSKQKTDIQATTPDIAPEQLHDFKKHFEEGVKYVENRFATRPKLALSKQHGNAPFYNIDSQTIFVPLSFIANLFEKPDNYKTYGLSLTAEQQAFAFGIEEAFHHYQFTQRRDQYMPSVEALKSLHTQRNHLAYEFNPIEADARAIVLEGLQSKGIISNLDAQQVETRLHRDMIEASRQNTCLSR